VTAESSILAVVNALGLPPEASIDARVPKKLLAEQGAPTPADKRAIQDGIDELQWFAACKPNTIGVPSFADETREYLEIAVIGCAFRSGAKATRLIELIHRAIPYPVLLITSDLNGITVSVAQKRHAQNEAEKVVIERVVCAEKIDPERLPPQEQAFLQNLAVAQQPRRDLCTLYGGWLARIEALNAVRLRGPNALDPLIWAESPELIERRREALEAHSRLTREITSLRAKANREKQFKRRVDLNLEIQRLETDLTAHKNNL
jgi:hypothetical protein